MKAYSCPFLRIPTSSYQRLIQKKVCKPKNEPTVAKPADIQESIITYYSTVSNKRAGGNKHAGWKFV